MSCMNGVSKPSHSPASSLLHHMRQTLRKQWKDVFCQQRTLDLAVELALTFMVIQARRHTIAESIVFRELDDKCWSRFYRFFSRSRWRTRDLFLPCLEGSVSQLPHGLQWRPVIIDDTKTYKTGKKIPDASVQRDSMSPPYHVNLRLAHRYVQASVALPLYRDADVRARAIPVRFEPAPVLKKPGRKATPEQIQQWKEAKKKASLSARVIRVIEELREDLDRIGSKKVRLMILTDGGMCNRHVLAGVNKTPRTDILTRCRKDAVLCMPAPRGSKRIYAQETFSPQQIRNDKDRAWQTVRVHYGGMWRDIQYKRVDGVLWQRGAKRRPLTLFVLRPIPYATTPKGDTCYRDAAYLLTTATGIGDNDAIQMYLDRWQIEVNHREEKHDLGVGQAQVWAQNSVHRVPAFLVASYAMMMLAALECHGPTRTSDYLPLPRWRKEQQRPSCRDVKQLLRKLVLQERANPSGSQSLPRPAVPMPAGPMPISGFHPISQAACLPC